ncbi:MAG: winged helix-turn-helix domain-containing protein [Methanospirillum sp.]|uniref:winged helix-turn-helix domain-containing protein n=1 Tax=Methanospirillum sp. TaxID=45200 RepID=UPI002374877A|nr:winged helix-turn-helix domain-containing protein [Methanospirillum sp.]MDD1729489.1 winged helix-turn-helix domain-containing protein [Methanospirillum sp.]
MDHVEPSVTPDALMHEIREIRGDLKRFFERTNQVHLQSIISDLKHEYGDILSKNHVERARECLSSNMVHDCEMHDTCFQILLNFLTATSNHINDGEITDDLVRSYRAHIEEMRKKGPYQRCDICFNEVRRLFEKQLDLMRSLGILKQQEASLPVMDYPEEKMVSGIIEPIASTPRFQILQAVSAETKTFSDLSQLTKLRGGNLLFHMKKLQEAGMIIQRHERGDYVITDKGFRVLSAIREVYANIVSKEFGE